MTARPFVCRQILIALVTLACSGVLLVPAGTAFAAGAWPQRRFDAQRGGSSPHGLPEKMQLQWSRDLPAPQPAWPASQYKLQFDAVPEPVAADGRIFVPSTVNDCVTAYEATTGKELWRYTTDGPVRFAPLVAGDQVCFVSDDGCLYCVSADDGRLHWKFRGGPEDRPVLGNERLISSWPARGAPVLENDVVYFAAGIWPFMGVFVHAVDLESGQPLWTNSGDSMNYITHPHGAKAFGTVSPQGYLAVGDGRLFVPGGRSMPAVYDLATGALDYFPYDKKHGHYEVSVGPDEFYVAGQTFSAQNGDAVKGVTPVLNDGQSLYYLESDRLAIASLKATESTKPKLDRFGKPVASETKRERTRQASGRLVGAEELLLKAGNRLYATAEQQILAYETPTTDAGDIEPSWSASLDAPVETMIAADDRLYVVAGSRLYCYGAGDADATTAAVSAEAGSQPDVIDASLTAAAGEQVAQILAAVPGQQGWAVLLGADNPALVEELVKQTEYSLLVVDSDADQVAALRQRLQAQGLYGRRVAVRQASGSPAAFPLPSYLANLIVVSDPAVSLDNDEAAWFTALRPYGGTAVWPTTEQQHAAFAAAEHDPQAQIRRAGDWTVVVKAGALPGAADWTHQYADPGQSCVSTDHRVKAPFGILWWGGPSHDDVLPRHGHGPSPQVAGGRVIVEGPDMLRAVDAYTGRLLWQRDLPGVGEYYNITAHFAGAGETGSNYVSLPDRIYLFQGFDLLELDAATGKTLRTFPHVIADKPEAWGYLAVSGDLLIAASSLVTVDDKPATHASGSRTLVVFDRTTGKMLWSRDAEFNFRHNNIAIGGDKLFCIDNLTQKRIDLLRRRGFEPTGSPTLYALDLRTGKPVWQTQENVFGTFLNYSAAHDLLLQAGSFYRDRAGDEVSKGMTAYRGADGEVLWKNDLTYGGPCMLWRDKIITNGGGGFSVDMKTGEATGWTYARAYGCNTAVASEHLLTFRSGAAGYYDLASQSGTGNVGGFRSSCTNNLIVADGLLNAPDYTRTCTCAYQNQTSLALVHMPEAELWATGENIDPLGFGVNLAAPGDRRDADGVLWRPYGAEVLPEAAGKFRVHSSQLAAGELNWVAASGVEGIEELVIPLEFTGQARLRLVFYEPGDKAPGERVFDLSAGKESLLNDFDIAQATAESGAAVIKTFTVAVPADGKLRLKFASQTNAPAVLSGVEVLQAK
ncbi:outer membrane protein assembly factor BamB family protein [Lignipirellula cremea]|uniref:Outer membrane biogenesis protein BamB n=1 Tax=Lignipirellula cremea TaxID=2528010 RepID=A0A518DS36_9BACT|nr:PQQ-binding-like beta-propeller repeat protein [Lignipirellula cremea]QDU94660.1 outer membrane biogenesis protein BamB [Lignipirellula cremea]